jgi:hypothetical protein
MEGTMKISKLQLMVITVIAVALIIAVIMINSRHPAMPKAIVPEYKAGTEEQKTPRAGRFELPEKEYSQEDAVKEELIPENVIAESEAGAEEKTENASTRQPGAETQEGPDKLRKKYPTPKQLRDIKEKGLIIY